VLSVEHLPHQRRFDGALTSLFYWLWAGSGLPMGSQATDPARNVPGDCALPAQKLSGISQPPGRLLPGPCPNFDRSLSRA
jgi:hypothetical protein